MASQPDGDAGDLRKLLREVIREELGTIRHELAYLRKGHDTMRAGQQELRAFIDFRLVQLRGELTEEIASVARFEASGTRTSAQARFEDIERRLRDLEERAAPPA